MLTPAELDQIQQRHRGTAAAADIELLLGHIDELDDQLAYTEAQLDEYMPPLPKPKWPANDPAR